MSAFSTGKCFFALALALIASFTTNAFGADPGVVKASHKVVRDAPPREIKESKEAKESREAMESNDANGAIPSYTPQWPEPPDTGAMLLRVAVGTLVVLALCVGTMWLGKPWLRRLQVAGAGTPSFHVEGSVSVGNRAMLFLVRVGETQLIAGTDATGLKSLIALPPSFKEVLDTQVPDVDAEVAPPTRPFEVRPVIRSGSKE